MSPIRLAPVDESDAALFERYRRSHDPDVRNELVLRYEWLAQKCARSMSHRGVPIADLVQVAEIGLIKAVERYDPERRVAFSSFAIPTVMGEIRRHFRDKTWAVNVPRSAKELRGRVPASADALPQTLGRSPTPEEIAEHCGLDAHVVIETQFANSVYRCSSLEQARDDTGDTIETHAVDALRAADPLVATELRVEAIRAIAGLPERSRKIILWRFYEECTQQEIGNRLGVGQVQVSRLLRAALDQLRSRLAVDRIEILECA
jgi:RNA polymerase sigma-B factor